MFNTFMRIGIRIALAAMILWVVFTVLGTVRTLFFS